MRKVFNFIKGLIAFALPFAAAWLAYNYTDDTKITAIVFGVVLVIDIILNIASILMYIGMNLYKSNKMSAAIRFMRLAYKTHKLKPSYQLIFSYILLRDGKLEESETVMARATVIGQHALTKEEFKQCAFNKALITWKKGDLSGAIVELEELHAGGYKTQQFLGSLSSFYILNKEYDKAIELAKEGIELNKTDLVSYDNLGQAYIGNGMLDEACAIYDKLLPRKPRFMEPYFNYGTIMEKRGKLVEAKAAYEMALSYDEKFLSTITHDEICEAIERVQEFSIDNIKIEDIVYEGTTEPVEYDASEELSDIEEVEIPLDDLSEVEALEETPSDKEETANEDVPEEETDSDNI